MDPATDTPRAPALASFLAGLEGGLVGALWMLAWLGVSAVWQQRNFWTAANLMATAFYGPAAIHTGFAWQTISGLALYLALYTLLGALLAVIVQDRLPRVRTLLVALIFSMAWYYFSFRLLWKTLMPLVALLHIERSTAVGHVIYGLCLGRYPKYLPRPAPPPTEPLPELAVCPPHPLDAPTKPPL